MIRRSIHQITDMVGGNAVNADGDVHIAGVSTDSRTVQPGNLFVPLVGDTFNGHDFAGKAVENGAAAVIWQEDYPGAPEDVPLIRVKDTLAALQQLASEYRKQLPVRVIGVTGSNGKTTTKDMVAACLATTYSIHKTQGNLNNHIGLPLTLLQLTEDTQMAVIEMGMSGHGEIELLSKIAAPEAAIITNIGDAHLQQLGSREGIAAAKLEITAGLREDGLLIYNGDEPLIERRLKELDVPEAMLRFRFGNEDNNDYYPIAIMQHHDFTSFKLNVPFSPTFTIPLPGRHNVMNAIAAIAAAKYMGVSEADIVKGLGNLTLTGMRAEFTRGKSGAMLLNDAYNANPTSMKAAIRMLEELKTSGRKIAVLADMLELGPQEEALHRDIGAFLDPGKIEYVFLYGPLAASIAEEAAKRYPPGHVRAFSEKEPLAATLRELLEENDLCLFKGSRGMKLEHVIEKLL